MKIFESNGFFAHVFVGEEIVSSEGNIQRLTEGERRKKGVSEQKSYNETWLSGSWNEIQIATPQPPSIKNFAYLLERIYKFMWILCKLP